MRRIAASILLACLLPMPRHAGSAETAVAEPPPLIDPADTLAHAGEECTVEFLVEAARKLPGKDVCFLNSCRNHRDEGNFTVVIFKAGLDRLKADGIENPAEHFEKATIRVRGVIEKRNDRPQMVVDEPGQISVVKEAEKAERPAE